MRFTSIQVIGVVLILARGTTSRSTTSNEKLLVNDTVADNSDDVDDFEEGQLPILPPIILLDFTNDTNSSSSEEKSKRTINGHLGYGFQGNSLFARKNNYYFPGGQSGTTVSIEESITPFLPKTIIENVKSITEKPDVTKPRTGNTRLFELYPRNFQGRRQYTSDSAQPIFGQRTKLHRTTAGNFDSYQKYSTTAKPTVASFTAPGYSPNTPSPAYSDHFTPKPVFKASSSPSGVYTTPKPPFDGYATSRAPVHVTSTSSPHVSNVNNHERLKSVVSSTERPAYGNNEYYQPVPSVNNYPKYTIENGVRYEHKIVWKYPDGKISEEPPPSYDNSYSEYNIMPRKPTYSTNYESPGNQNIPPVYANNPTNNYRTPSDVNLYYQGPIQFPKDQEVNHQRQQTQFVTTAHRNNNQPSVQNYNPAYYNNNFGEKQKTSENAETYKEYYQQVDNHGHISTYAMSNPNPAYTYTGSNAPKSQTAPEPSAHFFTSTGQLSQGVLSKYTPQAQMYLNKVFSSPKENYDNANAGLYSNSQYSDLLSYNPSISQYIKNPASILKAQPTFIQVGNSLIPVIILRIDGAPPIQEKKTPSINLKALLQQYITQYANSMSDFASETSYNFSGENVDKDRSVPRNSLLELRQLTERLMQYSQQSQNPASHSQRFTHTALQSKQQSNALKDSYGNLLNSDVFKPIAQNGENYESRYKKPQKVKSVQIIDDPRYASYKVKS